MIFFKKNESIVIEYSFFIFIFRTKSLSLNSQMSSMPCASRTTSVNFWFSHYLSGSPGEKSACTRPDQILWSSLEVGRSRSFSRYCSLPWLQLKLIEVAVQNWNSTKCILTVAKVWVKVMTFFIIPSLRAMFSILLHLPSLCTHILQTLILFSFISARNFYKNMCEIVQKNICFVNLTIFSFSFKILKKFQYQIWKKEPLSMHYKPYIRTAFFFSSQ